MLVRNFPLSVVLLANALASAQQGVPASQPATLTPVARADDWWQKRHAAAVERLKQGGVDLLFIGDSITQGWEGAGKDVWQKHYADHKAVNLGFSGDGTQHVLWRLENGEIDGISPKLAVVMIGTNNARHSSPPEIAAGVEAVVGRLRGKLPQTKILLLGIFPRSEKPDATRDKVAAVNALLVGRYGSQGVAADPFVRYLDISDRFLGSDGSISKDIMPDFLHLSPEGYARWAEALEPAVAELTK